MGRLKTGTQIERYIVEGALGEGGMARVYRVRHETLGTLKALKVLTLTARDVRKRLVQEGQVQAALQHDNIVKVEDVLTVKGAPALLMEFVDGPDLEAWLLRYQPSLEEALTLFRGICAGVGFAHSRGLIHRDLKPANVLLALTDDRMTPKVTDFGLAKSVTRSDFVDERGRTRTGATMGTPQFMAPEQIRDASQVDRRADMWSLGCILYRLTTGIAPFEGDDIIELFNVIAEGDFIPPNSLRRELPEPVVDAIEALLQPDPMRRLADCSELIAFLDGTIHTLGERTEVPLGQLRESEPPTTDEPRWLPSSVEASTIARDLVSETLSHLPKLRRSTTAWSPDDGEDDTDVPRPSERSKNRKKRNRANLTLTPPADVHTVVPLAPPPPPPPATAQRMAMGAVVLSLLAGTALVLVVAGFAMWQVGVFTPTALPDDPVTTGQAPPTAPTPVPMPMPDAGHLDPPTPPTAPVPATTVAPRPVPDPVAPQPAVVVPTQPVPAAPEPAAPEPATVEYSGAKMLWFEPELGGPAERDQEVPPGRYRIMAIFAEQAEAVNAGRITISEGQRLNITCVHAFQQCKP